jgi:Holliday junction resolvase-like predicted endonuclease
VATWYRNQGYQIIAQGWQCRDGALDLIARRGPIVAFCLIASAPGPSGRAAAALTPSQRQEMRRAVSRWTASANPKPAGIRLDIAYMNGLAVNVTEGAI